MQGKAVKFLASVLTAALLVAGCGGGAKGNEKPGATPAPAPQEEKRLTLYTSFSADLYNPMAEAFTKETGIAVDIVFAGTGEMLQRIDAEKADPQGDVMLGGPASSFEGYRGNFEPYQVKEDAAVPAGLKAQDRLWYGFNSLPMVFMYNKKLVTEAEAPKTWTDLQDPKWQGKIAMADANKSGTSFTQVVTMLHLFGKENGKGWEAVKAVANNAVILGSSSMPIKGTAEGEYAVGLTYEHGAWKYIKAGAEVGMIYPEDGTATIPDAVAVLKGAKHPNNARLFMDWLFTKETQAMAAAMGLRPARTDVPAEEGLIAGDQIKYVELDMAWIASNRSQILETWKDVLTSK